MTLTLWPYFFDEQALDEIIFLAAKLRTYRWLYEALSLSKSKICLACLTFERVFRRLLATSANHSFSSGVKRKVVNVFASCFERRIMVLKSVAYTSIKCGIQRRYLKSIPFHANNHCHLVFSNFAICFHTLLVLVTMWTRPNRSSNAAHLTASQPAYILRWSIYGRRSTLRWTDNTRLHCTASTDDNRCEVRLNWKSLSNILRRQSYETDIVSKFGIRRMWMAARTLSWNTSLFDLKTWHIILTWDSYFPEKESTFNRPSRSILESLYKFLCECSLEGT